MAAVPRTGPNPMVARCNHCAWEGNRFGARDHEEDIPGHRVTVWTDSTSQYSRDMWAPEPVR